MSGGRKEMPAIEIGRVCVKVRGREVGRKCVIVDIIDERLVLVTGPKALSGIRRRQVNIAHLEPLEHKVKIQKGASDEEVLSAIREAGLEEYMRERVKAAAVG